jgi:hypothetical protein
MTAFPPHAAKVKRNPKSWKYRLEETLLTVLVNSEHKLFVPGGHVELVSDYRNFVVAEIYVDRIVLHEGMLFDGSTFALDWGVMQRGAAVHDALCEAVDRGLIPAENQPIADRIMRDLWLSDAVFARPWLRRPYASYVHARYAAVRAFQRAQHGF